jgi:GNAT superfamily N-acetyltransferase
VVARRGERLIGYLIGTVVLTAPATFDSLMVPPRSARISYVGHAAGDSDAEIYRRMYAVLAPGWNAGGCFAHTVDVPASDRTALFAWRSLGFGQESVRAARAVTPLPGEPSSGALRFRRAGPGDIETVTRLSAALARYHAGPPNFLPYLAEAVPDIRDSHAELLASEENVYWLAERDGRAVAMLLLQIPPERAAIVTPPASVYISEAFVTPEARRDGVGTALLRRTFSWAMDKGYRSVAVNWDSANVGAQRFWRGHGFRPLLYRLQRRVDERIAWAH